METPVKKSKTKIPKAAKDAKAKPLSVIIDQRKDHTHNYRLGIYRALKNGDIKITPCDLDKLIEGKPKVLPHTSSSDSAVLIGNIKYDIVTHPPYDLNNVSNEIVLKLSFHSFPLKDNSLEVEICVYKYFANNMLEHHVTPNIMTYIGSYQCTNFIQDLFKSYNGNALARGFLGEIHKQMYAIAQTTMYDRTYNFNKVNVLMIERGHGDTLYKWAKRRTVEDWRSVMFQILYTLWVFSLYGLQHNDNHVNNIWIEDNINQRDIYYFTDDNTYYQVPVKYMVKLFDFDLASAPHTCDVNKKIAQDSDFCKMYGICDKLNPKFDAYIILAGIELSVLPEIGTKERIFLRRFINSVVSNDLLKKEWGYHGRLCNLAGPKQCDGPYTPSDEEMFPVDKMLKHSIFDSYRHNVSELRTPDYENCYFSPDAKDIKARLAK